MAPSSEEPVAPAFEQPLIPVEPLVEQPIEAEVSPAVDRSPREEASDAPAVQPVIHEDPIYAEQRLDAQQADAAQMQADVPQSIPDTRRQYANGAQPAVRHSAVTRTQPSRRPYTARPSVRSAAQDADNGPQRRTVRGQKRANPKQRAARPHIEDGKEVSDSAYAGKLTPKLILELAAPHTWAASTMPVLLAVCLSVADTSVLSLSTSVILLAICILMQSAVNTINDYFDYVKGTDTAENQADPTDAVLVYNDIDPRQARNLAIAFLVAAFALGIFIIVRAGWIPLVIALIGAVIVFLYSGGRTPISYLPIGEIVSGVTMGGLIPLACYQALTLDLNWSALLYSIPLMIGIALIMFTNNTCDIEKDIEAERKTLPVVLGRETAVNLYRALMIIWMAAIAVLVLYGYVRGWYCLLFMVAGYGPIAGIFPQSVHRGDARCGYVPDHGRECDFGYGVCTVLAVERRRIPRAVDATNTMPI
ncbi:MAG: UbiA family prenyltransferase [Eggerthellaceae bacterium]